MLMKSKIIIFISLILLTLLLLEIPKQYYMVHDKKLFAEQGTDKYETQVAKTVDDFVSKLDSFITYSSSSPTSGIGYTRELAEKEASEVFQKLVQELELLTAGEPEHLITEMKLPTVKVKCFTAQIFQLIKEEQFIWEVGFLEFSVPTLAIHGRIIYDTDSYKIILCLWTSDNQKYETGTLLVKPLDESSVDAIINYYSEFTKKPYIEQQLEYTVICPFLVPIYYVEDSSLFRDLHELANYFWYSTEPEKMIRY